MSYFGDLEPYEVINIFALFIGLVYGAISQKTQFCFSGSIKDFILTNSTRRAASVIVAIITAIVSSQVISKFYSIDLNQTIYLQADLNYITIILGGALFGSGMMIADGCSSRHLVKFSQGDMHSLVTIIFIAIFAYITSKGLFSYPISLIENNEFLISLSSVLPNIKMYIFVIIPLLLLALWKIVPDLKNLLYCADGLSIGLLVGFAWFVTGILGYDEFEPLPLEGLSFVFPSGKTLEYLMFFSGSTLSFSVILIFGILAGGFIMSLFNKKYRFGCAAPQKSDKLRSAIIGGSLMGTGGILSLGCTIGQGLTGLSTLALASFIAVISIAVSAYLTAKYMARKDALPSCFAFDWVI